MGYLRFNRRTRIAPGVRLNLSKSGPSLSFGGRGFHYTVGHGRRRTTVGVPGTGLAYTSIAHRQSRPQPPHGAAGAPTGPQGAPTARRSAAQAISHPGVTLGSGIIITICGLCLLIVPVVGIPLLIVGGLTTWRGIHRLRATDHQVDMLLRSAQRLPDRAEVTLQTGLGRYPHDPRLVTALAELWWHEDRFKDAAIAYGEVLTAHPATSALEARLADCDLHLGQWQQAVSLLSTLRQQPALDDDSRFSVTAHLSLALIALGDHAQALEIARTAPLQRRILSPALQQCLFMRACAHFFCGERSLAIKDVDRLFALDPGFDGITQAKLGMSDGSFHLDYAGHPVAGGGVNSDRTHPAPGG